MKVSVHSVLLLTGALLVIALIIVFMCWFGLALHQADRVAYSNLKAHLNQAAQNEGLLYGTWVTQTVGDAGYPGLMVQTFIFTETDALAPATGKYLLLSTNPVTTFALNTYTTNLSGTPTITVITDAGSATYGYAISSGGTVLTISVAGAGGSVVLNKVL
jgi:hypothetical protein